MKLSYRGANYEYNQPNLEVTEGEILGRYRGAAWRCQTVQELPLPQPTTTLKYRGVSYDPAQTQVVQLGDLARTRAARCVIPNTTASLNKQVSRLHRANLERNLERRLKIAQQQGDQILVGLLEAERRHMA